MIYNPVNVRFQSQTSVRSDGGGGGGEVFGPPRPFPWICHCLISQFFHKELLYMLMKKLMFRIKQICFIAVIQTETALTM